jgi:hypothetical protein
MTNALKNVSIGDREMRQWLIIVAGSIIVTISVSGAKHVRGTVTAVERGIDCNRNRSGAAVLWRSWKREPHFAGRTYTLTFYVRAHRVLLRTGLAVTRACRR